MPKFQVCLQAVLLVVLQNFSALCPIFAECSRFQAWLGLWRLAATAKPLAGTACVQQSVLRLLFGYR